MGMVLRSIEKQLPEIAAQCAEVRRERNRSARRRRREEQGWAIEARRLDAQTRAKLIRADRELERLLRFRIKIRLEDRPKLSGRTARKLYDHAERLIGGTIGTSNVRGRDGLYSLYFGWRSRGLDAQEGRAWRPGEAARYARYITRETALEAGEDGWFSNIGEDREELVAFFRALENVEKADRDNANVYISIIVPLPFDVDAAGRRRVAERITDALAVRGLPFVAALHLPDPGGDQRNFHLHVQLSLRPFERHAPYDWTFSAAKQTQLNTGPGIALMKRHSIRQINRVLGEQGIERRYTHRSRSRRGEAAGEMKRGRGSKAHNERIQLFEDARRRWAGLREHALSLGHHVRRHGELAARLAQAKSHAQAARVRKAAGLLDDHRRAAVKLVSGLDRLRKTMDVRTCAAILTASRTWWLAQRQRITAVKTKRLNARRLVTSQAGSLLTASTAGLELQRGRLARLRSWSEARRQLTWDKAALSGYDNVAAALRSDLAAVKMRARTQAVAALCAQVRSVKPLLTRHRATVLVAHALLGEARLRTGMSSVLRALPDVNAKLGRNAHEATQLRIRAAGLTAKLDPSRRAAVLEAVVQVDSLRFIPLTRSPGANGKFHYRPIRSAASMNDLRMAEIFEAERPVQAAYERKWLAMSAALALHLEQIRDCPFDFEPDRVGLKPTGIAADLLAAVEAAKEDSDIRVTLLRHANRWEEIEAERQAERKKKATAAADAKAARERRVRLLIERVDGPARPGTFSDRARAAIRQDVHDIGAALAAGEMALRRVGESFVFRSATMALAEASERLFATAAGRAAVDALHTAVAGFQPHADELPLAWTRQQPTRPEVGQQARSSTPNDVGTQPWKKRGFEIGD